MDKIDIKGLDKAELLSALFNAATPVGKGFESAIKGYVMTVEFASIAVVAAGVERIDYLKGVPLKLVISGDELDPFLYDRDHGEGRAAMIVECLKDGIKPPRSSDIRTYNKFFEAIQRPDGTIPFPG
jgi:hypothetical protein